MANTTRIKVDKAALIERIKTRRAEADAEYMTALALYNADLKTLPQRTAKYLTDLAKAVKAGDVDPSKVVRHRWYGDDDELLVPEVPSKPSKPRDYDEVIGQLEIAAEDTITITGEDYARYMR